MTPRARSASCNRVERLLVPLALVVLLGAIAQHQVALGLLLIVAFSAGLAATLTVAALLAVLLPAVSAIVAASRRRRATRGG